VKYRYIFIGIVILYISQIIDIIGYILNFNLPMIRYALITGAAIFFVRGIILTAQIKGREFFTRYLLWGFLIWTIIIIARGFPILFKNENNYINLKQFLSGMYILYLIPLVMYSVPNLSFIKNLSKFSLRISVLYLLVTIPLFKYFTYDISNGGEGYGSLFAVGSSLLLLTLHYHSTKVKWIAWLTILLALLVNSILARRNQVVYFSSIIIFTILINLFATSRLARRRRIFFLLGILVVFLSIWFYIAENRGKFDKLVEKTLTGMESRQSQIEDFRDDVGHNNADLIFGRGIFGTFKIRDPLNKFNGQRPGIENGYLQHILKGGIVYLALIIFIAIPAIYKGFFKSKNILSKAFAALVLTYLIDMIGFGIPTMTLKFIFVWVGIAVCYSKEMRNYSDIDIRTSIGI
jgi:hypothetical protein